MISDPERFDHVSSGIQSVVVSCAVVIGGIWTAYTFGALSSVKRAELEVEELHRRSNSITLAVSLEPQPMRLPGGERALIVDVHVKNDGARPVFVDLLRPSLGLALVDSTLAQVDSMSVGVFKAKRRLESLVYSDLAEGETNFIGGYVLSPGTQRTLSYYFAGLVPGVYHIDFQVPVSDKQLESTTLGAHIDPSRVDSVEIGPLGRQAVHKAQNWAVSRFVRVQ